MVGVVGMRVAHAKMADVEALERPETKTVFGAWGLLPLEERQTIERMEPEQKILDELFEIRYNIFSYTGNYYYNPMVILFRLHFGIEQTQLVRIDNRLKNTCSVSWGCNADAGIGCV